MTHDLDAFVGAYENYFEDDNVIMQNTVMAYMRDDLAGKDVLELGIGHGMHLREMAEVAGSYEAIEGSQQIIDRFNETINADGKIRVYHEYFESFDTDKRYDCIVLNFILEHVASDEEIMLRYRRFLKPDGFAFVVVPNIEGLHRRIAYQAGLLDTLHFLPESEKKFGHVRYYTYDSLKRLAAGAGYSILYSRGIFLKPFTAAQIKSLNLLPEVYRALGTVAADYPELCNAMLLKLALGDAP